ncbi:MarR family winged helix-turn-helix transcriptional regulator [Burkholderia cepacia]|uniref:MarR family transcriptional regulator n=1 Tax=Burkholderia cepacia GG4 TaxID=1009846 RepID=A0A9W3PAX7_BURCE|nr:MarR family transcriptional regulator [Burkholderia cepacia]AFQ49945.1 MarR family transcriptional regulator [Burkholderia cepacia GG4]
MSIQSVGPRFDDVPREADGFRTMLGVQLAVRQVLNQRMQAALGVQYSQGSALVQLARCDTMSCQALAKLLGCGTSRLTRLAQDLERRGLIVRRRNDLDRRALDLSLTARGRQIAERVPAVVEEAERIVLSRLSVEERTFLKRFLQRIVGEIDR